MKVAFDISPLSTGHKVRGIGTYTDSLVNAFKQQKGKVEFIFFENPNSPPPEADIIHYPYFDLFFKTLPSKKTKSRVVTIHDVIPLVFPKHFPSGIRGYINLFFQKRALANTDFVICDSLASKADIAEKLSYPKDKIKVIYLAPSIVFKKVDNQKRLNKISVKYKLPKEFALYVGDINWNKNISNLLEAIKIAGVNLVMVGESAINNNIDETRQINKLIDKLNLNKKIIKTGYIHQEDLVSIYNLATVTILPSFYEGFGLPVLESMACGTPVVCSNNSSLAEISGSVAIFCDPTDAKDVARNINHVFDLSEKEKSSLSQKLCQHAQKFSWQEVARQTIEVYQKIAG